jgi:hypothetical protein
MQAVNNPFDDVILTVVYAMFQMMELAERARQANRVGFVIYFCISTE